MGCGRLRLDEELGERLGLGLGTSGQREGNEGRRKAALMRSQRASGELELAGEKGRNKAFGGGRH